MGRPKKQADDSIEMIEQEGAEQIAEVEQLEAADSGDQDIAQTDEAAAGRAFEVQWDIKLNGRRFKPGDTVTLPADGDDAARFVASGAIKSIEG